MKYAQSLPPDGKTIQRTIEVEGDIQPQETQVETQVNYQVFFGLGAILLLIVAIGAAVMFWKNQK